MALYDSLYSMIEEWFIRNWENLDGLIPQNDNKYYNDIFFELDEYEISIYGDLKSDFIFFISGFLRGDHREEYVYIGDYNINFWIKGNFDYEDENWEYNISEIKSEYVSEKNWQYFNQRNLFDQEKIELDTNNIISNLSSQPHGLWFRGHADKDWRLVTSIARKNKENKSNIETELSQSFERKISSFDNIRYPLKKSELFFLMQHHGIPTRLLDWSSSPLTALYFVVDDLSEYDKDGCIWVLDPSKLNRFFRKDYPLIVTDELFIEEKDNNEVLSILAHHTNKRMSAQRAEFTIHSTYEPLESTKYGKSAIAEKIVIPKYCKSLLRAKLKNLGIDCAMLFPDLDNYAKSVNQEFFDNDYKND